CARKAAQSRALSASKRHKPLLATRSVGDACFPVWAQKGESGMRALVSSLAALVLVLTPNVAHAWGAQGHHLIAEVAYAHLTPHARAEVDRLIATGASDNATLCRINSIEDASTWADCVRRRHPFEAEEHWHFVDTPICGHAPPPCPNGDCVIAAINAAEGTLRNRHASDQERLLALARPIHSVAAVHQPFP